MALQRVEVLLWSRHLVAELIIIAVVAIVLLVSVVFEFFWHGWQSDSFWQVWQRINQGSLLQLVVVERATFSKLALTVLEEVSARFSLVV